MDSVNGWYDQKLIAHSKIIATNQILLTPGKIEGFGFHFSRDLIPVKGNLTSTIEPEFKLEPSKNGTYILSFQNWDNLSPSAKIVFETLRKRSN